MLTSFWIPEPFGEPKIDHIDIMLLLSDTYEEIVRFYVSMGEVTRVNKLDPLQHLICQHQYGLEGKFAFAVV